MPQAFSYIRFSSLKQELGDSVRRQEKRAIDYAARHNLDLDTSSYRDLGVSAFRGKNATQGNLSKFLAAIDSKAIQSGSYLLVESLDRISRNDVDEALELFLSIIRRGITVVTLDDEQVYSKERIRLDKGISLIISISRMSRANEESSLKSFRIRQIWEAKRERGQILTSVAPAWLRLSKDRKKWIVLKDKAAVVRRIFHLALAGNGSPSIARILNQENVPTMKRARHWTFGTVSAILKNQSVFGLYTPTKAIAAAPIPGYYPAIINETEFRLAQDSVTKRRWIGGRSSQNVNNLFAGISYCHVCGSKMRAVGTNGHHLYLRCLNAYSNNGCTEGRFPYRAAETAILRFLADDLSQLMATDTERVDPVVSLKAERDDLSSRLERLVLVAEHATDSRIIANQISKLEHQMQGVDLKLQTAISSEDREINVFEMHDLFDKLKGYQGDLDRDLRLRIQNELRYIIEKVEFWCDAEHDRPSVCLHFFESFSEHIRVLDVGKFREKVGGNRRKSTTPLENL